jgi:UDP:flavonoid glycosyltransferase YjiC (YdhE family)
LNILYGVQATGNGHISRSREIIGCLKDRGHDVYVILSGRDPELLWDKEIIKPYSAYRD